MALRVVLLDMLELGCFLEGGYVPIQMSQPLMDCRIP